MKLPIGYSVNAAERAIIEEHLRKCSDTFSPPLDARLRIVEFADKIASHAERLEAWDGELLVGLLAIYCNNLDNRSAFITHVGVLPGWHKLGIGTELMLRALGHARSKGMERVRLSVQKNNYVAINLYTRSEFLIEGQDGDEIIMVNKIK